MQKKNIFSFLILFCFISIASGQIPPLKKGGNPTAISTTSNRTKSNSNGKDQRKVFDVSKYKYAKITLEYALTPGKYFHPFEKIEEEICCREICDKEKTIIAETVTSQFVNEILSNQDLLNNKISQFKDEIESIVSDNTETLYDREFENPLILHVRIFYHREINNFLHKLLQVPSIRSWFVNLAGKYLQTMCSKMPKDFRRRLLAELEIMYSYIDEMRNHTYTTKPSGWFEEETLYIDGKEASDFSLKSQGFIIRRVIYDEIPKEELKRSIAKIIQMVKSVNIDSNPDVMLKCSINDDITYYSTTDGSFYVINATKEIIPASWNFRIGYSEAYGKGRYHFEYGNYGWSDKKWKSSSKDNNYIIDSSGKRFRDNRE